MEVIAVVLCFGVKTWGEEATLSIHEPTAFSVSQYPISVSQYPISVSPAAKIRHGWNSPQFYRLAIIYPRTSLTIILVPYREKAKHVNDKSANPSEATVPIPQTQDLRYSSPL